MNLPYENATSGDKALIETQKVLRAFGCNSFGQMMNFDTGELLVQFEYRGRQVSVKASVNGYAAAWLRAHPWSVYSGKTKPAHEAKAKKIGSVAVYSVLRDWIKGQVTAVETGVLTFEGAFLGQLLLPNGRTMLEHATEQKLLTSL